MKKTILSSFSLVFCLLSNIVFSNEVEIIDKKLSEDDLLSLSQQNEWLLLIHFESGYITSKSSVTTPSFFLSPNAKPYSELQATINAFFDTPEVQCQFPARKMWLNNVRPQLLFPEVECPAYQEYLSAFKTDSISVVYASGYLGNPASMYGHVLLKFNAKNSSELLDNTFSYGAIVPDSDNKLTYIYKGITGGYQGHFANQKYHHQSLMYNESELRDLWEYKLELPQQKIDFLLAHLWELENSSMTYFFFKQNCGYQLAKLLELVIEKPLLAPNKIWVMPYDLVMMLNKPDNRQFVSKVTYHESRQEKLYNKFNQLTFEEKQAVQKVIENTVDDSLGVVRSLEESEAKRVIDTMYDYYAFVEAKHDELSDEQALKRKKLLSERFYLPAEQTNWKEAEKRPPHTAQNTAMLQFSPMYNNHFGEGAILRFRANYYDLLNINSARIPYSELSTFDLSAMYTKEKNSWELRELTLFNIMNLNVSQTGLPEDKFYAWSLSAGYKPNNLSCIDCSDLYIAGFLGKSLQVADSSVAYVALANEIQFPVLSQPDVMLGPEIGGVHRFAPFWESSLKLGSVYYVNDMAKHKDYIKWEQRFFNNRNFDVRTLVRYDEALEYAISFSTYW